MECESGWLGVRADAERARSKGRAEQLRRRAERLSVVLSGHCTRAELLVIVKGDALTYAIGDPVLIDVIYTLVPFSHRMALHLKVVEFLALRQGLHEAEGAETASNDVPLLVHHYIQAQVEDKAMPLLQTVTAFGGGFVERWALENLGHASTDHWRGASDIAWCAARFALAEDADNGLKIGVASGASAPAQDTMSHDAEQRVLALLPALPWLRGLDRALRSEKAGRGVIQAALHVKRRVSVRRSSVQAEAPRAT